MQKCWNGSVAKSVSSCDSRRVSNLIRPPNPRTAGTEWVGRQLPLEDRIRDLDPSPVRSTQWQARPVAPDASAATALEAPYRRSQSLEEYLGSYYRNLYSFRSKGLIKRSLVVVQADSNT